MTAYFSRAICSIILARLENFSINSRLTLASSNRSSTVSGILFLDDQVLERLRGQFLVADFKM
jgi:hypothetical protein